MHLSKYKIFHFIDEFDPNYILKLNKNIILIFRNYTKDHDFTFYIKIRKFCKSHGYKILLSNNYRLALKANFDGVYVPSFNKNFLFIQNKKKNFITVGSAHNNYQIKIKEKQGVDYIFISPLFMTKNKKGIGIYRFLNLCKKTKKKVVILGGINKKNIKKIKLLKINAFASISYIKKNAIKSGNSTTIKYN